MKAAEPPEISLHGAKIWPLSIPAYRALGQAGLIPKNTELLYGVVYRKMSKSPMHSTLVRRLLRLLRGVLVGGCFATSEQPLTCKDSEAEPDVAVIRGNKDDFWEEHPHTAELVIEVCVSSHEYGRSKLRAYAEAAVKEVWLILVPEKKIEVHRRPLSGRFAERKAYDNGRLICGALPQFELDVRDFFEK